MQNSSSNLLTLASKAAFVLLLSACSFTGANASSVNSARTTQVDHVCAAVMGLSPGEAHFDGCVISLTNTLAKQDEAQRLDRDRQACASRGLKSGTRDFAVCVLDASQPKA